MKQRITFQNIKKTFILNRKLLVADNRMITASKILLPPASSIASFFNDPLKNILFVSCPTFMLSVFNLLKKLDLEIDYVGQEFSHRLMYLIIITGYALSLLLGLVTKDLTYTLVLCVGTAVFGAVATVPSWPYFRRNPLKFKKAIKTS